MRDVPVPFAGQHGPFVSTAFFDSIAGWPLPKTSALITIKKVLFVTAREIIFERCADKATDEYLLLPQSSPSC
jgi:hypothetical protein